MCDFHRLLCVTELHRGWCGVQRFQVGEIFITDPLDVSVLEPANGRILTLITCYPFHYVGFAPDRLIVRAQPRSAGMKGWRQTKQNQPWRIE
jgi:sortase (surface protein transpeptidase)